MNNIIKLIASILLCLLIGFIGSFFTAPSIEGWYASLAKPSFNPPNWVFGPVWTTLYIIMGISLFLILRKRKKTKLFGLAIFAFSLQLYLNLLWSIIFFGFQLPFLAFLEIIILWIQILLTIIIFWKISKIASILLFPYIAWVTLASVLNYFVFILNR